MASADGGQSWTRSRLPLDVYVWSLDFVDRNTGWALTSTGLWGTVDGGSSWQHLSEPSPPLQAIDFVTAKVGWSIQSLGALVPDQSGGQLLRTADGGRTWQPVKVSGVYSVAFADPSTGWADVGRTIWGTTDGGTSWRKLLTFPWRGTTTVAGMLTPATAREVWVEFEENNCGAGSCTHQLVHTTDGFTTWAGIEEYGATYDPGTATPSAQNHHLSAKGGQVAAFAGGRAVYLYATASESEPVVMSSTQDGGRTWNPSAVPDINRPWLGLNLAFASPEIGWVAGQRRTGNQFSMVLDRTKDGGKSWTEQEFR